MEDKYRVGDVVIIKSAMGLLTPNEMGVIKNISCIDNNLYPYKVSSIANPLRNDVYSASEIIHLF